MTQPTQDYQITFAGVTLGPDTPYEIDGLSGLEDLPEVRVSDQPIPGDHGLYPGVELLGGRTVEMSVVILGGSAEDMAAKIAALGAVTVPMSSVVTMRYKLPGRAVRRLYARPRRRAIAIDTSDYMHDTPRAALQFQAFDPRLYSEEEHSVTVNAGETVTLTNAGTFETRPTVTFAGIAGAVSVKRGTSETFTITYTVESGETVTADFAAKTLTSSTGENLYAAKAFASRWWVLPPGASSVTYTGSGSVVIKWRDAWA